MVANHKNELLFGNQIRDSSPINHYTHCVARVCPLQILPIPATRSPRAGCQGRMVVTKLKELKLVDVLLSGFHQLVRRDAMGGHLVRNMMRLVQFSSVTQ